MGSRNGVVHWVDDCGFSVDDGNEMGARMTFGFGGILTIVLVILKLTDHIDWSWIWVVMPICVSIVLQILFLVAVWIFSPLFSKSFFEKF